MKICRKCVASVALQLAPAAALLAGWAQWLAQPWIEPAGAIALWAVTVVQIAVLAVLHRTAVDGVRALITPATRRAPVEAGDTPALAPAPDPLWTAERLLSLQPERRRVVLHVLLDLAVCAIAAVCGHPLLAVARALVLVSNLTLVRRVSALLEPEPPAPAAPTDAAP